MKNYIRDVIDRYIKHDYPEEVDQDFRTWLTSEERADEKDCELNKLWEVTEAATTPGYRDSLERMHELTGSGQDDGFIFTCSFGSWRIAAALLIAVSSVSIYWRCRTVRHRICCKHIFLLPKCGILLCRTAHRY